MRLTHILVLMTLLLLAGLLSVEGLESASGLASVPGLVLLEACPLEAGELEALAGRWPGATFEWVVAEPGPLAPFHQGLERAAAHGNQLLLLSAVPLERDASGSVPPWHAVLDAFPDTVARPRGAWMTEAACRFIGASTGARGFLLAMQFEARDLAEPEALVDALVEAARPLPSYRRTTIVVLGALDRSAQADHRGRRPCLRIPVGDWSRHARPDLADLLDL